MSNSYHSCGTVRFKRVLAITGAEAIREEEPTARQRWRHDTYPHHAAKRSLHLYVCSWKSVETS
jgi:hypothetical protein